MQLDCNKIEIQKVPRIHIFIKNKPDVTILFEIKLVTILLISTANVDIDT